MDSSTTKSFEIFGGRFTAPPFFIVNITEGLMEYTNYIWEVSVCQLKKNSKTA